MIDLPPFFAIGLLLIRPGALILAAWQGQTSHVLDLVASTMRLKTPNVTKPLVSAGSGVRGTSSGSASSVSMQGRS